MNEWIGVDLDGTLAKYDGWVGPSNIGEPIEKMVRRVQHWVNIDRMQVKIVTARAHPTNPGREEAIPAIEKWCTDILGFKLPITHEKDLGMVELWDDRAVQVIPNTGERADGKQ